MTRVSLADFAKTEPPKPPGMPCWACHIPERDEIDEARRAGVQIKVIRRWLIEHCGYSEDVATKSKLDKHFSTSRHHEREIVSR